MDKNNNLSICRAIMRIYTFSKFDPELHILAFDDGNKSEALSKYLKIEPQLKDAFADVKIDMRPTPVKTSCDNEIVIAPEVFFIYNDEYLQIPDNILDNLKNILGNLKKHLIYEGKTVNTYENQKLFWAYTGRIFNVKNKQGYITDGLQCPGKVIIDLFTYSKVPHDTLHYRLIHELLHSLGISEEEMNNYIKLPCQLLYGAANEFVDTVLEKTNLVMDKFMKSLELLNQKENNLVTATLKLSNEICENRFSNSLDEVSLIKDKLEYEIFPEFDSKEYNIFFM